MMLMNSFDFSNNKPKGSLSKKRVSAVESTL